ncbi:unnamed protein product [Gemmataceae bacterium]|nr:unnamed protein product [Gemmataceae bacterium]VTT98999.1 unnamed protein product [Gemmataceae bacterium]
MQITLYRRSYAASGAPVSLTFNPDHAGQRHTFTADGRVYEARQRPVAVTVPDDAQVDELKRVLRWRGSSGAVVSTAQEVYDFARAGERGFNLGKA